MQTVITLAGIALFIVAAYRDVKSFRIPNWLVAAIALLALVRLVAIGDPSVALYTVEAGLAVLAIAFVLFALGYIGGGDAKLITAAALLIGCRDLYSFLVFMCISGAIMSIVTFATKQKTNSRLYVPYGVAIATAASVTLFFQTPFHSFTG